MSVKPTMVAVLKYVLTLHLGTSRVHAMLAMLSMLMAVYVMVGHMYHTLMQQPHRMKHHCVLLHYRYQ